LNRLPGQSAWPSHYKWSYITEHADYEGKCSDLAEMTWLKQLEISVRRNSRDKVMRVVDEILSQKNGWKKLENIYSLKKEYDRWRWGVLLEDPGIIPDTASRVEMLSRLRYGIPFWWSLADYRHRYLGDVDPLSIDLPDKEPTQVDEHAQALRFMEK